MQCSAVQSNVSFNSAGLQADHVILGTFKVLATTVFSESVWNCWLDTLPGILNTLLDIRSHEYWVNLSKRGGKDRVFRGLAGLLRGISRGRSPREIPRSSLPARGKLHPYRLFTHIYILFLIGFRIGPSKMHRHFRIGLPKIHILFRIGPPKTHKRFRIGPPQVTLNLLLPEFHSR